MIAIRMSPHPDPYGPYNMLANLVATVLVVVLIQRITVAQSTKVRQTWHPLRLSASV